MSKVDTDIECLRAPSDQDAKEAVCTLIRWIGDDPKREGLTNTAEKVLSNYKKFFSGYHQDLSQIFAGVLEANTGMNDIVMLRGIKFTSFCEHHMLPFEGHVDIAYIPTNGILGFDRISQLVDCFANRLQIQERMTNQIAEALYANIKSNGVAVSIKAHHKCMSMIGSKKEFVEVYTEKMLGSFESNNNLKDKFLTLISRKLKNGVKDEV